MSVVVISVGAALETIGRQINGTETITALMLANRVLRAGKS